MLHVSRSSMLVCIVLVVSIVGFAFLTLLPLNHSVEAQGGSVVQLYLPSVAGSLADDVEQSVSATEPGNVEDDRWPTYTSKTGGYSLRYPDGWEVTELKRGAVQFTSPSDLREEKVWIEYLNYEMPEQSNLLEWAKTYHAIAGYGAVESYTPVDLAVDISTGESAQVFYQKTPSLGQGYLISHGRLVLMVFTLAEDKASVANLTEIASSLEFSSEAPRNFTELYAPEEPPVVTTIEAYQQEIADTEAAARAFTERVNTGETPDELLAAMSDRARQEYERLLVEFADVVAENDEMRAEMDRLQENPPPPLDQSEYEESERLYNETLQDPQDGSDQELPLTSEPMTAASVSQIANIANRRGLPARYRTPIRVFPRDINCGSPAHINKEAYAADISAVVGTDVYGTGTNETVMDLKNDDQWNAGYGNYVKTRSIQWTHGVLLYYYHMYAHLDEVDADVQQYDVLNTASLVGQVGTTGDTEGPHLHYSIWTANEYPVDLSPVKGLTPDLDYPDEYETCGYNRNPDTEPIIIEANEFQSSWTPVTNPVHNWSRSTYYPNHTAEAYRAATPTNPNWGYDPITAGTLSQTPRLSYQVYFPGTASYRVWVCGMGGTTSDDSVHMGINGQVIAAADRMTGYESTSWVWRSVTMDNASIPWLPTTSGYNDIDLYMRENSMRVDRILLTTDFYYSPDNADIRCGAEGLP